jgi:hypothetical protein
MRRKQQEAIDGLAGQTSIYPRQDLLQVCKELFPPALAPWVGLLLIRPEARLNKP